VRIIRGPVGVVAMWFSTLSPLIFGRVRALDYYDYFDDLVSSALLFCNDVVSFEIVRRDDVVSSGIIRWDDNVSSWVLVCFPTHEKPWKSYMEV